ncbi:MAG: PIN domain-containing protein [Thermomicrobiales bacterium]
MELGGAVLDANVLFPVVLRDTLLRAADAGYFRPYWNAHILAELSRNLIADAHFSEGSAARLIAALRRNFPHAEIAGYEYLVDSLTNHPRDRHALAAANHAGAPVIVTANLLHFPREALRPHGIVAQSPDTFLMDLLSPGPRRLVRIIREQSADMRRPPMTVDEAVDRLEKHAPRFGRELRRHIE